MSLVTKQPAENDPFSNLSGSPMGKAERVSSLSSKTAVILLSCWIVLMLDCSRAEGGGWRLYHQSDEEFYFYDIKGITKSATGVKVSEKSVLRQTKPCNLGEAIRESSVSGSKNSEMTDELHKKAVAVLALQETRRLYEIRCQEKMYRIITGMEYDKEETLIDGILSSKWDRITPDSVVEKLHKAVCP